MSEISIMPGCLGEGVWREGKSGLTISLQGRHEGERCPECQRRSTIVHGYYDRHPADLPVAGR